jgi:hypothetical protein
MIDKIRVSLKEGMKRVRWITMFLAERTRAETEIGKLMFESSKLESKMEKLYIDIGKRAVELQQKGEKFFFNDFIVQQAIAEIKDLKDAIDDYKKQAKELSNIEE